ncbi:hypothetical protein STENM223S_11189 [Streptomyces tendae]
MRDGASSSRDVTVSFAQERLVPMTPVGPRLIQPATYSPGATAPPRSTRPARCGTVPVAASKGSPAGGTPRYPTERSTS